jgi:adenylate cyclase
MRTVSLAELAEEAGASLALVERLVELGQLRPLADGRFDPRSEAIVTSVSALLEAGIREDDLAWVVREAGGGLDAIGQLFQPPTARSPRTYGELRTELGAAGDRLAAIYAAFGLVEPRSDSHLRLDEEAVIRGFVGIWQLVDPGGDADVRIARLSGDTTRRLMDGWLDAWDAAADPTLASQGAPGGRMADASFDPTDPEHNPSLRGSVLMRDLIGWLHERQLEQSLNRRVIDAFEAALVKGGRIPARPESPPAIAFVDLSGFTRLTLEEGDDAAAAAAVRLGDLADSVVRTAGGRVVKLLGDGVLLRFGSAAEAIPTVLRLVEEIKEAGLPAAHAGVAAGRLVIRDGDVYGQTVNLAARIAGQAGPSQVVVEEGAVIALPAGTARFEPLGRFELKGIPEPVGLWLATSAR